MQFYRTVYPVPPVSQKFDVLLSPIPQPAEKERAVDDGHISMRVLEESGVAVDPDLSNQGLLERMGNRTPFRIRGKSPYKSMPSMLSLQTVPDTILQDSLTQLEVHEHQRFTGIYNMALYISHCGYL